MNDVLRPHHTRRRDRWARHGVRTACVLLAWMAFSAHVGTNQVVLEGRAGGYPIRVLIDPPGVVPSQVPILVRILEGQPTRVTVRAAQWNIGTKGAPPAEDASPVPGDPGVWSHALWIMTSSTYSVYVAVEGPAGAGTLVVPMQTNASRTLGMDRVMGGILLVVGSLLIAGMLSIVGASTREGSLPPGAQSTAPQQRRARVAMAVAAGVIALALFGGSAWWRVEDEAYRRRLYRPLSSSARVRTLDADRILTIAITDSLFRTNRLPPLMPDHGKLMHLFLVRADPHDAIAHLHPLRIHADSFVARVPALPAGRYLVYGDLLFQSGAQRTLVDTIDLPVAPVVADVVASSSAATAYGDADDSWRVVRAVPLGDSVSLSSGGSLRLRADADVVVKRDLRLVVTMHDASGGVLKTEPYMGMGGHAMVLRRDAGIFMHLHPMGTASMSAQAQLMRRERGDTARLDSAMLARMLAAEAASMANDSMSASGRAHVGMTNVPLSFPFAFPSAGDYRVFVQVKRGGVIETAAFDVHVPERLSP